MFYNTGIATYIWVLTNRKPEHRKGKVQLIDARELYTKLRKNLGSKNCEFTADHIRLIMDTFLDFAESDISQIKANEEFGYHKITVERPLRLKTHLTPERLATFKADNSGDATLADGLLTLIGDEPHLDFNVVQRQFNKWAKGQGLKVTAKQKKALWAAFTETEETARPVIKKKHKDGTVEYEADSSLRDTENVPLTETIESYFTREVLPHVPDAWIDESKTVRGYEIPFTKFFYQYEPLRSLEEIVADIRALEAETDGILEQIVSI
jgi:type I restriction enzyme M protein